MLIGVSAQAADKRPIRHEDLWLIKRVGAPVPSPDGRWVVFSVTEPSYEDDKQVSDLWIVPADGSSPPRRLTFSKGSEADPAWSPDSRRIAFTAKREGDEENQIYVLDVAGGGEAIRYTNLAAGASEPRWSPDGKSLLFQSRVYPGARNEQENRKMAAERRERKYRVRIYEGFPIRHWDRWLDETKLHPFVQRAEPGAEARDLLAGTRLAGSAGFAAPFTTSGSDLQAVWAPDGESVIITATINRHEAARAAVVTHLFRVPVTGGEAEDLTPGKDSYSRPAFGPDGRALYALYEPTNEWEYNLNRLARLAWPPAGEPQVLTPSFDRSVGSFAVAPDGAWIYLLAEEAGHTKPFRVAAGGGTVEPVLEVSEGTYSGLAIPAKAPATVLLANWESARSPREVVRMEPERGGHRALTEFARAAAAELDLQPVRHFWFTSRRGRRIHSLVALPPGFDETKRYPLVVFIHGGPHSMSEDDFHIRWNYALLASPGYVVLAPNYTGSTGFGEKFAQAIQGDPLKTPGEEINEAVDEAVRRFAFLDGSRVAAGGASYGGHLANWLQATTTRYRCLYSHAGLISLEGQWATSDTIHHREVMNGGPPWGESKVWQEQSPFRYAEKFRTPVLLTIGVNDYRVPLSQTLAYWSILKRQQIPSRLVVFERANHWVTNGEDSRYFFQELHGWLARYLKVEGDISGRGLSTPR